MQWECDTLQIQNICAIFCIRKCDIISLFCVYGVVAIVMLIHMMELQNSL